MSTKELLAAARLTTRVDSPNAMIRVKYDGLMGIPIDSIISAGCAKSLLSQANVVITWPTLITAIAANPNGGVKAICV